MPHIHFLPGKSLSGKSPMVFSEGFTIAVYIRINPQKTTEQQTILRYDDAIREVAELFVHEDGSLVFGAGDHSVIVEADAAAPFMNRACTIICTCLLSENTLTLELELNNEVRRRNSGIQEYEPQPQVQILGGGAADFGLQQLVMTKGVMKQEDRKNIVAYFESN